MSRLPNFEDERVALFSDFSLDLVRGSLMRAGTSVHLRPQTYEVLRYLSSNKGRLISKEELIDEVWEGRAVTDGALGKCIEELREALGPDARQYLRNVRGRGYILEADGLPTLETVSSVSEKIDVVRMVVEREEDTPELDFNTSQSAVVTPLTDLSHNANWKRAAVLFAVALAILSVAIGSYWFFARRQTAAVRIQSLAVLPFSTESANSDIEYLSDGMTESLINSLSRLPNLSVKARSSVFRYKGKEVDPQRIAADLSVEAILTGRFVQHGDDLTLYLSLVDTRNGNQIWGEQYDRKVTELVALERETVRVISEKLSVTLNPADKKRLQSGTTDNSEAYRAYLKGRYYWNNPRLGGFKKSREYFQQAIDLDPAYALGYSGLSHYYGFGAATGMLPPDENWQRSESAIKKAIALDDTLAESYNALAGVQLYYEHNWSAAESSFRHGIELDPNSAEVRHHYSRCLILFGRNDEALEQIGRTLELEPLSLAYNLSAGKMFFFVRQYDRAVDQLRKTLELEPKFAGPHDWLGYVYEKMGKKDEAIAEWATAMTLNGAPERAALLERTYRSSGFASAVRLLAQQRLQDLTESATRGEYVAAGEYVIAYTRLGDREQAFQWLDKATKEHSRFALEFKSNPVFDSLRSDPRFGELANRVKV